MGCAVFAVVQKMIAKALDTRACLSNQEVVFFMPTPKMERWKYTNLAPAVKNIMAAPSPVDIAISGSKDFIKPLKTVLNEPWVKTLLERDPPGDGRHKDMGLWHLHALHQGDGYVVDVPVGKSVSEALNLRFTGHGDQFTTPRLIIRIADHAEFTLIEEHTGEGSYWNNAVAQIIVGKNAKFYHYRLQNNAQQAVYTQNTHVEIADSAIYEAFNLTNGAKLSRNQVHIDMKGSHAVCHLNGLNLLRGDQHGDSTFLVEHQAPHGESHQFMRTLLDDRAHGVFQGKVHVHQAAQKTDGYQLSNALMLSSGAIMDTKPELEIYADDVKCSHGATTGQIDEEPLFYLRSRGLSESEARRLLVRAFVDEVVDKISDKTFAEKVGQQTQDWLRQCLK